MREPRTTPQDGIRAAGTRTGRRRAVSRLAMAVLGLALAGTPAPAAVAQWESEEVRRAYYGLVDRDRTEQERAAAFLAGRGDRAAIPAMVDALRYDPFRNPKLVAALEELSGRELGDRYDPWAEWMVREGIEGPPGYRRWKADFLSRLHPRFGVFLDPDRRSEIAYEEIRWGGVPPEGIPSLDDPATIPASEADWLDADELVFAASVGGESRAYPLRILDWHEMTNDTLGGVPVALSYCTLCGSGVLFDRRVGERTFTFATSGLLYRSNKLMFDRETETLWSNLTGRPVLGPLVEEALQLDILPVVVTTWERWRRENPSGTVLSLDTGYERDYTPGRPYGEYFASPDTMFPVGLRDDRLPAKAWVFAMRVDGRPMAFELEALRSAGVANVSVGERPLVLVAGAGRAVRAFDRETAGGDVLEFQAHPDEPGKVVDGSGRTWIVTDLALVADGGPGRLERQPGHLAYWFGWYAFFPDTGLWPGG